MGFGKVGKVVTAVILALVLMVVMAGSASAASNVQVISPTTENPAFVMPGENVTVNFAFTATVDTVLNGTAPDDGSPITNDLPDSWKNDGSSATTNDGNTLLFYDADPTDGEFNANVDAIILDISGDFNDTANTAPTNYEVLAGVNTIDWTLVSTSVPTGWTKLRFKDDGTAGYDWNADAIILDVDADNKYDDNYANFTIEIYPYYIVSVDVDYPVVNGEDYTKEVNLKVPVVEGYNWTAICDVSIHDKDQDVYYGPGEAVKVGGLSKVIVGGASYSREDTTAKTIKASTNVPIYVNITSPYKPNWVKVDLTNFGVGVVDLTLNSYNETEGWYNYTATVDLTNATYDPQRFYVEFNVTLSDNSKVTYIQKLELTVEPNVAKKWIFVEADTKRDKFMISDYSEDSAIWDGSSEYISANLYIAVADEFGNVNDTNTLNGARFTGYLTVASGPGILSKTSVTIGDWSSYDHFTLKVPSSDATCKVTVEVYGGGLEKASKTVWFYDRIDHLYVEVLKPVLYANSSDYTNVKVYLKDSENNTIPLDNVKITLAELTALGLTIEGDAGAGDNTNKTVDGVTMFKVTAGEQSGEATIRAIVSESGDFAWNGRYGDANITLKQAPDTEAMENTVQSIIPDNIVAGKGYKIEFTVVDYAGKPIKNSDEFPVKFNITSGDAVWLENNAKVYTVESTDANGNVSATLYSTNATTTITVNISIKNENGEWVTILPDTEVNVKANNVSKIAIFYNDKKITSFAYPQGVDKSYKFTIKYLDAYGNVNKTGGTVKIYAPETCYVGTFTTTSVSLSSGVGSVEFKTNKSAPVGTSCKFIFNDTTFKTGNVTLTIAVSGVEGIYVSFNKSSYNIGETVLVKAQLKGANGIDLAKPGVKVTFVIEGPGYMNVTENVTDENGIAITTFKATKAGVWKVTASNASVSGTNSTTVAGNASKILLVPLSKEISVNTTVTFNITVVDENGYPTMKPKDEVKFIVKKDDVVVNTTTVKLEVGKASFSYNFTEAGNYTVIAWYNETLFNTSNIHVSTVAPTPPTPTTPTPPPTNIEQTIHKYYPSGNVNSKNDVLQAIINAINDYFSAPSDKKTEILNDIIAMINHYFTLS